ncbi:MAG: YHS domain-containing protein [Candidatus Bathyarchaeia archaeon]
MLCCLGLFAGVAIGSYLGGPWTIIAPAMGFGLGLIGDMKLMRGSHKGHEGHGGSCCGGGHIGSEKTEGGVTDPVCGMKVDEKTTKYKIEFSGKTYYFCSSACESTFKENPRRYAE